MAYYSDDSIFDSSVSLRHWFLPAILFSLLAHSALFYGFSQKKLDRFTASDTPRLIPRAFNVKRVEISQKLLDSPSKPSDKTGGPSTPLLGKADLSQFDGSFEKDMKELRATPEVSSPEVPDIKEKPSIDSKSALAAAAKAKAESALALDKDLSDVRQQLMNDKPAIGRPKLAAGDRDNRGKTDNPDVGDSSTAGTAGIPAGFSNLDDLLGGTGRVGRGTAPILMPTDLLFDYDSSNLRPGATSSLGKLGRLIQRNPQAIFRVEGHTDSFGPDAYNLELSQRRAETVKAWLVENMQIDPVRIQAQGFGKSRMIVPPDRTVEEQQLNRRVEIVIRPK
jgi:outer membrane protein OmpA-like peptidoglycan-associated protein